MRGKSGFTVKRQLPHGKLIIITLISIGAIIGLAQAFYVSPSPMKMYIERVWVLPVVCVALCSVFLLPRPKYYGMVGLLFLITSGLTTFFGLDFFNLRKWSVLMFMLGLFLLFDAADAGRNKDSFIQRVSNGHFSPLLVTAIISFFIAFLMEEWNHRINYWVYPPENYPLPSVLILNVPLIVYAGWVTWILALIEMVRVFSSLLVRKPFEILLAPLNGGRDNAPP